MEAVAARALGVREVDERRAAMANGAGQSEMPSQ
jgi:hypothetical protein